MFGRKTIASFLVMQSPFSQSYQVFFHSCRRVEAEGKLFIKLFFHYVTPSRPSAVRDLQRHQKSKKLTSLKFVWREINGSPKQRYSMHSMCMYVLCGSAHNHIPCINKTSTQNLMRRSRGSVIRNI